MTASAAASTTAASVASWVRRERTAYVGDGPERPLGSFGGLMAGYGVLAGAAALLVRRQRPQAHAPGAVDLALLAVATAKLSRLLARDRVTSPLRAPFTTFEDFASADEVEESPRGSGARRAMGELVTCPWCLAQWVGTGVVVSWLLAPRATRMVCASLAVVTAADVVQHRLEAQAAAAAD
jgi:hypothetical protein